MFPRLITNKFLRKGYGGNNFVTDFPNDKDSSFHDDLCNSNSIFTHHEDTEKYKVFVSTWNVGGMVPPDDLNMEEWLDTCNSSCDIYVLGFQEVVPLKAANVLGPENKKTSKKWNSLIRETLNKKIITRSEGKNTQENKDGKFFMQNGFRCIISKQMVGIFVSVWVRSSLLPFIHDPSFSCIGCGIMGYLGNKGSVSVRFRLHETSFCFVCSHLASGGREGDEKYRNSDATNILSRTTFPRGPSFNMPRKILDHDRVIFLGDLNYRISMAEETTQLLAEQQDWEVLFKSDQLRMELKNGVFEGWNEGKITFAPTYKYIQNSDVYYGYGQGKKGEKRRAPAWCDRVIWSGDGLKQHQYSRGESKLSDHRPVKAIFSADVGISGASKGFENFYLSNRFERFASQFEDELLYNGRSSFQL